MTNLPESKTRAVLNSRWSPALIAAALFAVYQADGTFLFNRDTEVNALNAVLAVESRRAFFTPQDVPDFFVWEVVGPAGRRPVQILRTDALTLSLERQGLLAPREPTYLARGTRWPGFYVNTFGWGVWLSAVPMMALLQPWLADPDWRYFVVWHGAKWIASLYVAGSAAIVFTIARRLASPLVALLTAIAYGLGTAVWAVSSQALWQHPASEFFLALGVYGLVRSGESRRFVILCGAGLAAATWCRHPNGLVVMAVGVYFLLVDWRACATYVLAGLPLACGMFALNAWAFGAPFTFGEMLVPELAIQTTGSPAIWQTPLWLGLPGLLISPSRGLFVFSPVLLFGLLGAIRVWRRADLICLRPLPLAIGLLWLVHARHYDWWGGWCYGYRHIVDSAVLLAVLLSVVLGDVLKSRYGRVAFALCLAWSITVQGVGAFAFDIVGWNDRVAWAHQRGTETTVELCEYGEGLKREPRHGDQLVRLDIDKPEYRGRLWSIRDNQIGYYLKNFAAARRLRCLGVASATRSVASRKRETYAALARELELVGHQTKAQSIRMAALAIER